MTHGGGKYAAHDSCSVSCGALKSSTSLQIGLEDDVSLILDPKAVLTVLAITDKGIQAAPHNPSTIKSKARSSIVPGAAWNATSILTKWQQEQQSPVPSLPAFHNKAGSVEATTLHGTKISLSVVGGTVASVKTGRMVANVQYTSELACAATVHILDRELA
jgi:hypothetical protein